jgi:hypothetical protein
MGSEGMEVDGMGTPPAGWHAGPELLERYAQGRLPDAAAWSVEAHLPACAACRRDAAALVDQDRLDRVWAEVTDRVDHAPRLAERLLIRAGFPEHVARLLAATPSLRRSWLLAVAAVLAFAVVAAHANSQDEPSLFLVLAPLLPLGGVAAAYGPRVDPTYEIGLAAPMRSLRLLLIRAAAVLMTTAAMAGAAGLLLPQVTLQVAAWLLPALGLTLSALALAPTFGLARAAGGLAAAWLGAVATTEPLGVEGSALFGPPAQAGFAAMTVVAALVLYARRRAYDTRRRP